MPKLGIVLTLFGLLAFLAGCQPVDTFNPLYTDKDLSFDPALLGKWALDEVTLELSDSGNGTYTVLFSDAKSPQQMVLEGRLVILQGHRFLDLIQKNWMADHNLFSLAVEQTNDGLNVTPHLIRAGDGAYLELLQGGPSGKTTQIQMHLRLVHWFVRVINDDKHLQLAFIDDERLDKALQAKTLQITHVIVTPAGGGSNERHLALTATTAELQKFVLDHVNDDQVFADSLKYHRADKPKPR